MSFIQGLSGNTVFMIFLTLVLGYAFGRINFAGVKFGTSGVLIVALIFGALGMQVPAIVGTAGIALFFVDELKEQIGNDVDYWKNKISYWRKKYQKEK